MNFVLCVFYLSILLHESLEIDDDDSKLIFEWPPKRRHDDYGWIWETTEHTQTIKKSRLISTESATPDIPVNEPQPYVISDFKATGRRVSELSCFKYISDLKPKPKNQTTRRRSLFAILTGRDAATGEFPHMAAIGWKLVVGTWKYMCGGSLISSKFVLTAAHCTRASELDTTIADVVPKIVSLGNRNILKAAPARFGNRREEKILHIFVHQNYEPPKKYFDIALLELENDVAFYRFIQPACLWTKSDTSALGSRATVTGWGVIERDSGTRSAVLQAANVDVIDSEQCDQLLRPLRNRNWRGVQDHQMCAGVLAGDVDTCQGDSGGPLQVKISLPSNFTSRMYYVIGVTSFGYRCGEKNTPGVYTRVSSFIDWIENIVWG